MAKLWQFLRILGAVAACVILGMLLTNSLRNRAHDMARTFTQLSVQQAIDNADDAAESYVSAENGLRVYYVNAKADMIEVKGLLAKCKPLKEEILPKPVDCQVLVGGLDIGFAGGNLYFLPAPEDMGDAQAFALPEPYNAQLWALLDALPNYAAE